MLVVNASAGSHGAIREIHLPKIHDPKIISGAIGPKRLAVKLRAGERMGKQISACG